MEENQDAVLTVSNLSKSFGDQPVLKDVSFSLRRKENLSLLGKSGSGKSVLVKCVVGLIVPDSGSISVFDKEVTVMSHKELNLIRTRIGFLFQNAALYDSMSVRDNLEFPLRRVKKETDREKIDSKVENALAQVGLSEAIDKMPSELSGGMRKRVGLARTLIMDPEIILYDEPTTGLDPRTSHEISELIVEVQKSYQASSLIITHDADVVRLASDRLLMIRNGGIYAEGTFDELKGSKDEWVASFLN